MNRFLAELRRRKVFRVAAVYLVAGWIILQVVDVLVSALSLPTWVGGVVTVFLVAAFPVAIILAWAFEVTPEGVQRSSSLPGEGAAAHPIERWLDFAMAFGLLFLASLIAWQQYDLRYGTTSPAGSGATAAGSASAETVREEVGPASIAVLPFADLSPEGDQEYFSDGISEEILNLLARIEALSVTSRTSAFAFRNQRELGIRDIASILNVRYVLEGSVRTAGESIRITAQLIEAATDQHLWTETYDQTLSAENLFAIQDEIASAIAGELAERIGVELDHSGGAPGTRPTTNLSAYEAFLEGRDRFINRNYENLPLAIAALEEAVRLDPEFARAWGQLAVAYAVAPEWGFSGRDYAALAADAVERGLELDPRNSMALTGLALNATLAGDHISAVDHYEQAVAADPQNTTAHVWLSQAWRSLGFFERADRSARRCLEVDPDYPICIFNHAEIAVLQGQYELGFERLIPVLSTDYPDPYPAFLGVAATRESDLLLSFMLREASSLLPTEASWMVADLRRALSAEEYDRAGALALFEARLRDQGYDLASDPYVDATIFLAFRAYDRVPQYFVPGWWWFPGYPGLQNSPAARAAIEASGISAFWRERGFPPQCRPVGTTDFACH